jgi:hypothetical protein
MAPGSLTTGSTSSCLVGALATNAPLRRERACRRRVQDQFARGCSEEEGTCLSPEESHRRCSARIAGPGACRGDDTRMAGVVHAPDFATVRIAWGTARYRTQASSSARART